MYIIDITRGIENDVMVGNDSMSSKAKVINYVMDYVFANYGIMLDKNILDQNLNIDRFSLKQFLNENYSIPINKDLKIQSFFVDKDYNLFLKYSDEYSDFPSLYFFNRKDTKKAQAYMRYIVNDALINKLQNNLQEYDRLKMKDNINFSAISYPKLNIRCELFSLADRKNLVLEELLNNACTYRDISSNEKLGVKI